jgi:putative ABC transport system permease protein
VGDEGLTQAVEPRAVMEDLLSTILRVRTFLIAGSLLLGVATTLAVALVFLLSLRLRRAEIETILKIGGSRFRLVTILAWEILLVIALSSAVAGCLTLLASRFSETVIRGFLL